MRFVQYIFTLFASKFTRGNWKVSTWRIFFYSATFIGDRSFSHTNWIMTHPSLLAHAQCYHNTVPTKCKCLAFMKYKTLYSYFPIDLKYICINTYLHTSSDVALTGCIFWASYLHQFFVITDTSCNCCQISNNCWMSKWTDWVLVCIPIKSRGKGGYEDLWLHDCSGSET
jgi:hypothetical protein